jgi:hypothetical protein
MTKSKQVLEFQRPSKILCQISGRQNHWSLMNICPLSLTKTEIFRFVVQSFDFSLFIQDIFACYVVLIMVLRDRVFPFLIANWQ